MSDVLYILGLIKFVTILFLPHEDHQSVCVSFRGHVSQRYSPPALEDFDWERILKRWYEYGHMDAVSKSRRESLVLKRLREEQAKRSFTPIGTKKRRIGEPNEPNNETTNEDFLLQQQVAQPGNFFNAM